MSLLNVLLTSLFLIFPSTLLHGKILLSSCPQDQICTVTDSLKLIKPFHGLNQNSTLLNLKASEKDSIELSADETDEVGWFIAEIYNDTNIRKELAISINESGLKLVKFLKPDSDNQNFEVFTYGLTSPKKNREFQTSRPISRLFIEPGQTENMYIYVDKVRNRFFKIQISSLQQILNESQNDSIATYVYLGIVGSMMLYQFFLFFSFKEVSHLLYLVFAFCIGGTVYLGSGQYALSFDGFESQSYLFYLSRPVGSAVGMVLPFFVFETKKQFPKIFALGMGISIFFLLATLITSFGDIEAMKSLGEVANIVALPVILSISIFYSYKGSSAAWTFLLGWTALIAGVLIWLFKNHGIIDANNFTKRAVIIGSAIEMIMVGLAISIKVKENEIKRVKAEDKVRELSQVSRLLRIVCHDIMNPMTLIMNAVTSKRFKNETLAWEWVERSGNMVVSIIEHVRKLEAMRSGKSGVKLEAVDLSKIFHELKFVFSEKLENKGVSLTIPEASSPYYVLADENSLMHDVLANFISNSIKFSFEGGCISISLEDHEKYCDIKIRDQGVGIENDKQTKIFDPSEVTSTVGTKNEKGTGFGMALAKSFIEDFGGKIILKSKTKVEFPEDHGTTIIVSLPRAFKVPNHAS